RNSAPQDFTICGSPGTRNSQPKAPNTGWPFRTLSFTGLVRTFDCLPLGTAATAPVWLNASCFWRLLRVELALPLRPLQGLCVDEQVRLAPVRDVDGRLERALAEQAHAFVGMADGVRRHDHVVHL